MAENQNEEPKKNEDENDPYKFFKFAGPEDNKDDKDKKKKKGKIPFWPVLLITLLAIALADVFVFSKPDNLIDFSEFRAKVISGEIVYVELGESYIVGYTQAIAKTESGGKGFQLYPVQSQASRRQYKTAAVLMQSFITLLDEQHISYKFVAKQNNYLVQLLINLIIPFGIIFLMYFLLFRKMGGGGGGGMGSIFNVGSSRAKVVEEGKIKTRFTDVAGVDEAKEELVEVVDFLKSSDSISPCLRYRLRYRLRLRI